MWIIVEVDKPEDIGKNEKRRLLSHDEMKMSKSFPGYHKVSFDYRSEVHPVTPGDD